jgi:MOSC domain-containing protein YiiM
VDRCDTCRFDASQWTAQDLAGTLPHVRAMAAHLSENASADVAARLAKVLLPLQSPPAEQLAAVHQAWHLLSDAGRLRQEAGEGAPATTGVVEQVSVSQGGVPKLPVLRAAVTARGVSGDKQATRKHHGRPWQAVCLWSAEVVDALAAEGHPIGYGSAGENVTLRGLPWHEVRPGVRLLVGSALVEVTAYAIPCRKNAQWFSDGRFRRMAHEVAPGTSRVYARVLADGVVAPGDAAVLEPLGVPVQPLPAQRVPARQDALF